MCGVSVYAPGIDVSNRGLPRQLSISIRGLLSSKYSVLGKTGGKANGVQCPRCCSS